MMKPSGRERSMTPGVDPERVRTLNDAGSRDGRYVLYWMQSSHRTEENPALRFAVERADRAHLPLVVSFGLWRPYPEAGLRHFTFMLQGLREVAASLESRGVTFVLELERPDLGFLALAKDAALAVVDRGYLRLHRAWYRETAERCPCTLFQVEANVVVPVETASGKEEYSAATFRPKVMRQLGRFLHPLGDACPERSSLALDLPSLAGDSMDALLSRLEADPGVPPSERFVGGSSEAMRRFEEFLDRRLDGFAEARRDPGGDGASGMSPYLHYGQVSPSALAHRALERAGDGAAAFIEELVVRRELAVNFVRYNDHYDSLGALPAWAQHTLALHRDDPREVVYAPAELERSATHDPYWNAAQRELVTTGMMQGYMRMYWGKKILEWSRTPEEAYATTLALNNTFGLDGRDPGGYAGVAWCFGKHDRPWKERPVFGTVRYMNARGLERKFHMNRYLERVGLPD
ncbi:DNA photolyase [anaerobic digester metagenome]